MKNALVIFSVAVAFGLAGCQTAQQAAKAPPSKPAKVAAAKKPAAPHIQKVFKKGSKVCEWMNQKGKKGTDYFYKDKKKFAGSADRVIGDTMKQGTWQITNAAMNLNWYGGKKGKGRWYKVRGTGKKSYELSTSDGKEKYWVVCK